MGKIAVVGGSGFIGARLAARLLERPDAEPVVLDLAVRDGLAERTVLCDATDPDALAAGTRGCGAIVHLAAAHADDVRPVSRYYEVNVGGAAAVCEAARRNGIRRLIYLSSMAAGAAGHYGRSKLLAEREFRRHADWFEQLTVIRPAVVFGEGNRGNVYNLYRQIRSGWFVMIGRGENRKSMAYVGNLVAFIEHMLDRERDKGTYHYADRPDLSMRQLVGRIRRAAGRPPPRWSLPYPAGLAAGALCDLAAAVLRRRLPVSRARVRKFRASSVLDADDVAKSGFAPPWSLLEGLDRTLRHEALSEPERRRAAGRTAPAAEAGEGR